VRRWPSTHDHAFLLRCGYRHSELLEMSVEEVVARIEHETAYERAVAEVTKAAS
jgi:hypothetical protein